MLPYHDCIDEPRFHEYDPERRLCAAILMQAWKDAKPRKENKHPWVTVEARRYINSTVCEPLSFEWLCQVIDINPSAVRKAMAKIIEKHRNKKERMRKFVFTRKPATLEPEADVYLPRFTLRP